MRVVTGILLLACLLGAAHALGEKYRINSQKAPKANMPNLSGLDPYQLAVERNKAALERAYANDLMGALGLFEDAARLHEHPEFISNVGVTLMRMGRAWEAKVKFERALELDARFENAVQNLRELTDWMKGQGMLEHSYNVDEAIALAQTGGVKVDLDFDDGGAAEGESSAKTRRARRTPATTLDDFGYLQHHTEPLPRVSFWDLDSMGLKELAFGRRPFVITGLHNTTKWAASPALTTWSFQHFADNFGDKLVDFYPHNMPEESVKPLFATMRTALAEAAKPSGIYRTNPDHPGTYIQWNVNFEDWQTILKSLGPIPSMFKDFETWLQACLDTPQLRNAFTHITHWHMMLFGSRGAGMFHHWDIMQTASYQIQITGRKLWHICSPENTPHLYGAGKVDTFDPDYDAFPDMRQARCFLDIVEPGEMMFYPHGYWHQTENLAEENIAVSGSVVDANCYKPMMQEFDRDCASARKRFAFTPAVCEALQNKCYPWWEEAFTGSFTSAVKTCSWSGAPM